MSSTPSTPEIKKSRVIWFALFVIIVAIITIAVSTFSLPAPDAASAVSTTPSTPSDTVQATSSTPNLNATIAVQQERTVAAVAQMTHAQPITGRVDSRPDFISEVEWQTLKMIAQKSPTPDQELTRLVSNMRFNKQMEVWQSLAHSPDHRSDQNQRHALASQLLADIPSAVTNQALDQAEAQKAQMALLGDLEPDSRTRKQRIAQEAARIGMTYDIQASSS